MKLNYKITVITVAFLAIAVVGVILVRLGYGNAEYCEMLPSGRSNDLGGVYVDPRDVDGRIVYELNYDNTLISLTVEGDLHGLKWAGLLSPWQDHPIQLVPSAHKLDADLPGDLRKKVESAQRLAAKALAGGFETQELSALKAPLEDIAKGNFSIAAQPNNVGVGARDYAYGGEVTGEWSILPPDTGFIVMLTMTGGGFVAMRENYQLLGTQKGLFEFGYRESGEIDHFEGIKEALQVTANDVTSSDRVTDKQLENLLAICKRLEKEKPVTETREQETKLMKEIIPWDPEWQGIDDTKNEPTVLPNAPVTVGAMTISNAERATYGCSLDLTVGGQKIAWWSAGPWARIALATERGPDKEAVVLVSLDTPLPVNTGHLADEDEKYLDELVVLANGIVNIPADKWPSSPILESIRKSMQEVTARRYSVTLNLRDIGPLPRWHYAEGKAAYLAIKDRAEDGNKVDDKIEVALSTRGFTAYDPASKSLLEASEDGLKLVQEKAKANAGLPFPLERFMQLSHVLLRTPDASLPGTRHGMDELHAFLKSPMLPPPMLVEKLEMPQWTHGYLAGINDMLGIKPDETDSWPW